MLKIAKILFRVEERAKKLKQYKFRKLRVLFWSNKIVNMPLLY